MIICTYVGLGTGHTVRWGPSSPSPRRAQPRQFLAHIRCGEMAAQIKMPLGMEVGLGPGDFVLDGDPAPPPQERGQSPQILAHVYCGQTAGWIKIILGTEVGLGLRDVVLDGEQALLP